MGHNLDSQSLVNCRQFTKNCRQFFFIFFISEKTVSFILERADAFPFLLLHSLSILCLFLRPLNTFSDVVIMLIKGVLETPNTLGVLLEGINKPKTCYCLTGE